MDRVISPPGSSALLLLLLTLAVPEGVRCQDSRGQGSRLPPVPEVHGPLAIRVVYPSAGDVVSVDDSSFILGSVGDGAASLSINGQRIPVAPNGGFLGWVAYPAGSPARFALVVRRGDERATLDLLVKRSPRFVPKDPARAWIDTLSLSPRGRVWWPGREALPLAVRASPGAKVELVLPNGKRVPFAPALGPDPIPDPVRAFEWDRAKLERKESGDRYRGFVRGLAIGEALPPVLGAAGLGSSPPPPARVAKSGRAARPGELRIEAIRGRDTARVAWPLRLALLDSTGLAARLADDPDRPHDRDSLTVGRAGPGATYHWFFPTGTLARVSGRINDDLRLALSDESAAWVAAGDATQVPAALVTGPAVVGSIALFAASDRVTARIPVTRRVPYRIDEAGSELRLTLYGAVADVNWLRYGPADPLVALADWRQRSADEVELTLTLRDPVFGYRARWEGGDLLIELRRPIPARDPSRPLAGRRIAIDPGHPPVGSTGPTGLTEAEANLGVANQLVAMLEAAGAQVIVTRTDSRPIELWARVHFADSAGAELLVSIHNNALPDGLNPFVDSGSSAFFFHPRSLPLARAIQRRVVEELGQRDLGVARGDLALARPTWMPAVLVEGLFMMIPEHEAALRSVEGQRRYARAVFRGIEDYFGPSSARP